MKRFLIPLTAAVALAAAAPAMAQPYHDMGRDGWRDDARHSVNERQARIDYQIERGLRRGDLTRREAFALRSDANHLAAVEARYRSNGFSPWERADLDRRLDQLEMRVRFERRDHERHDRYGWNDRRW